MDVKSLYDREIAYYTGRSVVMWLPEPAEELNTNVQVEMTETGVKTTITAPYSPLTLQTVSELQVLNKTPGHPTTYVGVFNSADTATLTPAPSFSVGQSVTIGANTYKVVSVVGAEVTFERAISDLLVYAAQTISDDVTYQWQLESDSGWVDIIGATERTYEPLQGDVGKELRVIITYTDGRGEVGESDVLPAASFLPNQTFTIYPVFPVIADLVLDVQRSYAANTINKLVVELETL